MKPSDRDWRIRLFIYERLIATSHAPTIASIAKRFLVSHDDARQSLRRLHDAHALVLDAEGDVLMAHPLAAQPTDYRVWVDDAALYANCAWDSLGIPAMLGCDARIQARHPLTGDTMNYAIQQGELHDDKGGLVHFAHPFRHWYADIVDT